MSETPLRWQSVLKAFSEFRHCRKCRLCETRAQVVPGRGLIPAELLMIGEAPGKTEDAIGDPFVGRAGKLLDRAVEFSLRLSHLKRSPSIAITNCVLCRPCDNWIGPNREPSEDEASACRENVERIICEVNPRMVIFLGKIPARFMRRTRPDGIAFYHPAYLLRLGGVECPEYRRFCRDLSEVFRTLDSERRMRNEGPQGVS